MALFNDTKLTKDETKRAVDAVASIQEELDNFNPDAEATAKMQDSVDTLNALLGVEAPAEKVEEGEEEKE